MSHNTLLIVTPTTNDQPTKKFKGERMKAITRTNLYLPMAAILLTVALAVPAAAQNRVPLGTMQGDDIDSPGPSPTTVVVSTSGTGIGASRQFSFSQQVTVDFTTGTSTGSGHWVAANGDSMIRRQLPDR
jgi:hypothetical protein